jgi:hypothetical protein
MALPGPEVTHRWQGRTLVDHNGELLGSIEVIYLDKVTNQPEWALLKADATGPARTFVPLVNAGEEGDTILPSRLAKRPPRRRTPAHRTGAGRWPTPARRGAGVRQHTRGSCREARGDG